MFRVLRLFTPIGKIPYFYPELCMVFWVRRDPNACPAWLATGMVGQG